MFNGSCLAANSLVFLHVMKTGGLAVDARIRCGCVHWTPGCAYVAEEDERKVFGEERCEATAVRSTHEFRGQLAMPMTVTILRDPIARVWSFYRYLRRWYVPYQNETLSWHLATVENKVKLGFPGADDIYKGVEPCHFCELEIVNGMSMRFAEALGEDARCLGGNSTSRVCLSDSPDRANRLRVAKEALKRVDIIGFTELLGASSDKIMKVLWGRLPPRGTPSSYECPLPLTNVHEGDLPHTPDRATKAIIRKHNAIDIDLFEYAAGLPQALTA